MGAGQGLSREQARAVDVSAVGTKGSRVSAEDGGDTRMTGPSTTATTREAARDRSPCGSGSGGEREVSGGNDMEFEMVDECSMPTPGVSVVCLVCVWVCVCVCVWSL